MSLAALTVALAKILTTSKSATASAICRQMPNRLNPPISSAANPKSATTGASSGWTKRSWISFWALRRVVPSAASVASSRPRIEWVNNSDSRGGRVPPFWINAPMS